MHCTFGLQQRLVGLQSDPWGSLKGMGVRQGGLEPTRHVAMHAGAASAVVGVPLACLSCQRCGFLDTVGDPVVVPFVHCSHTCGQQNGQ